jgi:hemoglobin-like flavoprotein
MRSAFAAKLSDTSLPVEFASPLTVAQVGLVRATFQILEADRDRLAEMFYARAVALDPQIQRPQPVSNMVTQRLQLMLALSEMVQQLDDLSRLAQTVSATARRYGIYGASDPRFRTARTALIWAVERILQPERDSAIQLAWNQALDLVETLLSSGVPADR